MVEQSRKPQISVIMPVYNTKEEYFREAIESILNQSFKDFEFLIIDNEASSECKKIIKQYQKAYPFIKVVKSSISLILPV